MTRTLRSLPGDDHLLLGNTGRDDANGILARVESQCSRPHASNPKTAPPPRPSSWAKRRLDHVADFCLGKMLDQRKNKGDLLPYLANINVRWGEFDFENLREMRFEEHELDRFGLKYGDIVMCEGGEPGRCAIWRDQIPGMMIQKALHRIRPHKCLTPEFLYYTFLYMGRTGRFSPLFTGATIKHLPREKLALLEIVVPPLDTQQRITDVLSPYDDLIENNTRRIGLLEQAARLLYEEWFIRLRFPGHEHTQTIDGVPNGWIRQPLASLAEVNRESLRSGYDGEIEYVDISSVTPGEITATEVYDFRDAPSRARRVVRHGDIIWSCVRPNRRSHAVVWNPPPNLIVSTGFATISPALVPTTFLYFATTTDEFVGYLENRARGAAYPAVLAADFQQAEILVPPQNLTAAFDDFTSPILSQAHTLRTLNTKLSSARDLLLPRLMTGEIKP